MNFTQKTHLADLQDILASVYGLADMLEQDGIREGSEDEALMLPRFWRGSVHTAIKHLSNRASTLVDIIEEQESRKEASLNTGREAVASFIDNGGIAGGSDAK